MGQTTKIEWADHTASPWYGCAKVHAGCDHCYAESMAKRNPSTLGVWGEDGVRVKSKSFIENLRKWNDTAKAAGRIDSVFPSLCDPFEDRPELVPWREEMFAAADQLPHIRLLLLTKRPENVRRMWSFLDGDTTGRIRELMADGESQDVSPLWRRNVWLLTSVSDQSTADVMVPELLLKCRDLVPVLGLSCEPLLGLIKIDPKYKLDWIIGGGESGPKARPMHPDWARSIRDQCQAASVPFFFKQWGEWKPCYDRDKDDSDWRNVPKESPKICRLNIAGGQGFHGDRVVYFEKRGKKAAGRLLDGREHNEFPEVQPCLKATKCGPRGRQ